MHPVLVVVAAELTWAVCEDPAAPPRFEWLTIDHAQQFTDWPITQMRELGAARVERRRTVATLSGGDAYPEYVEGDDVPALDDDLATRGSLTPPDVVRTRRVRRAV